MDTDQDEMKESPLEKVERTGNTFTVLGTVVSGLAGLLAGGFFFGLFFGGVIRDTPARLDKIDSAVSGISDSITTFRDNLKDVGFLVAGMQKDIGRIDGALTANKAEDERQWDEIRDAKAKAKDAVSEKAFYQWRVELERQNRGTITTPPLVVSP